MPELPEVETIKRSLVPRLVGRRVLSVRVHCSSLRETLAGDFAERLQGRCILNVRRRAKYLICDLDDGRAWLCHLGMSGRLLHFLPGAYTDAGKHDHVIVDLDDGGRLVFQDPRRFGFLMIGRPTELVCLAHLGPEPFARNGFDGSYLARFRTRTTRAIKDVLMDQRVVAGLGNIYVNEILHVAGIRPNRRMPRVSRVECEALVSATRLVLRQAIADRGTSISDFLDGVGRPGRYQFRRRVYGRSGEACALCGTAIKQVRTGQRSSFYCPRCQR